MGLLLLPLFFLHLEINKTPLIFSTCLTFTSATIRVNKEDIVICLLWSFSNAPCFFCSLFFLAGNCVEDQLFWHCTHTEYIPQGGVSIKASVWGIIHLKCSYLLKLTDRAGAQPASEKGPCPDAWHRRSGCLAYSRGCTLGYWCYLLCVSQQIIHLKAA